MYKENYETKNMRHKWSENENELFTSYGLKKNCWHDIDLVSEKKSSPICSNTPEDFFSKHYWGTSKINRNSSTIYKIDHPLWKSHKVLSSNISFDFNLVFGSEFKHLTNIKPSTVHLFDGSEVLVHKKKIVSQ